MALITTTPQSKSDYTIGDIGIPIRIQLVDYDEATGTQIELNLSAAVDNKVSVHFETITGKSEILEFDVVDATNGEIVYATLGTEFPDGAGKYEITAKPEFSDNRLLSTRKERTTPAYLNVVS